ncbi:hypothetical protein E2C01_090481 [Portunus trituberculatus]|uniref:Uncharacterized protein n=1 Tax=Portunus trituberculatus TaxID=210409 RepID=A0A5B7JET9_PORTR|nr:hypothetical protein [Portunus trituberculatus]
MWDWAGLGRWGGVTEAATQEVGAAGKHTRDLDCSAITSSQR